MLPVCSPEMIQGAVQLLIYWISFLAAFWTLLLGVRSA